MKLAVVAPAVYVGVATFPPTKKVYVVAPVEPDQLSVKEFSVILEEDSPVGGSMMVLTDRVFEAVSPPLFLAVTITL
jgi:hypothetical protein